MKLLNRKTEPKTHDYTWRSWGHDYAVMKVIDGGQRLRMIGWGTGIKLGDYLLIENQYGGETRYLVESVTYMDDPTDMWSIEAAV